MEAEEQQNGEGKTSI